MDPLDLKIVQAMQANGRISFAALGRLVNLSTPAVHHRVKVLEERGVITGYRAQIDPDKLGLGLSALVAVDAVGGVSLDTIVDKLRAIPEVETCWTTAGTTDLILRVRTADATALERLLMKVRGLEGVGRTRSTILLATRFKHEPDPTTLLPEE
jgi:Lrp/AsnC family transcriptional regulator, leucine-responsive regulatory protein